MRSRQIGILASRRFGAAPARQDSAISCPEAARYIRAFRESPFFYARFICRALGIGGELTPIGHLRPHRLFRQFIRYRRQPVDSRVADIIAAFGYGVEVYASAADTPPMSREREERASRSSNGLSRRLIGWLEDKGRGFRLVVGDLSIIGVTIITPVTAALPDAAHAPPWRFRGRADRLAQFRHFDRLSAVPEMPADADGR